MQREALDEAVRRYEEALTPAVGAYLLGRGIDQAVADTFRLGVVSDPAPGHARFEGFLSIPYLRLDGQPLSVRFRCLRDHDHEPHGKYMTLPSDPVRVFNVSAIEQADAEIHVTEGEFDAMILTKVGLRAVGIPGASNWSNVHRHMLAGFKRIYVWGDPDDAGADFINRVCRSMRQARGVQLRFGDVTETYLEHGAEGLFELIEEGK